MSSVYPTDLGLFSDGTVERVSSDEPPLQSQSGMENPLTDPLSPNFNQPTTSSLSDFFDSSFPDLDQPTTPRTLAFFDSFSQDFNQPPSPNNFESSSAEKALPTSKKISIVEKKRALLQAKIDYPDFTWDELSELNTVHFSASYAPLVFSRIRLTYEKNNDSINKYVSETLSKDAIITLFSGPSRLEKISAILQAKIDHPDFSWKELSKLDTIYYTQSAARTSFFKIRTEYMKNPSSIDKYVTQTLSKDSIIDLFSAHKSLENTHGSNHTILEKKRALLKAKIDHPDASWKELSELNTFYFSAGFAPLIFSEIKKTYEKNNDSINKYVTETLSKDAIITLFSGPSRLEKISALLKAKIDHPDFSWKELSKLDTVHFSVKTARSIFSVIKKTYKTNNDSIDKYVTETLSKNSIIDFFSTHENLEKIRALLKAKIDHPKASWKELSKLNTVHFSQSWASTCFSRIKAEYMANPSSIDKYVTQTLSKDSIIDLFSAHKSLENKDGSNHKILEKKRALLKAKIDHPKASWRALSELATVHFSKTWALTCFSRIKAEYMANPSSIEKYVTETLSKDSIIDLFSTHKNLEKKSVSTHKNLEKIRALLKAKIDHPDFSWRKLSELATVHFSKSWALTCFSRIKAEYMANPNSIEKYVTETLSKESITDLFSAHKSLENKYGSNHKILEKKRALLKAKIDHPDASWKELSELASVPFSASYAYVTFSEIKEAYKTNNDSIDQYVTETLSKDAITDLFSAHKSLENKDGSNHKILEKKRALLKAKIDHPDASWKELSKLASVPFSASYAYVTFSEIKEAYKTNNDSIDQYVTETLSKESIIDLFSAHKSLENKHGSNHKILEKKRALLKAKIDHPKASRKKLSELDTVSSSKSCASTCFSRTKAV